MAATLRTCCYGLRGVRSVIPRLSQCRQISRDDFKNDPVKKGKPHPETPQFPNEYPVVPPKGKIYDKKPFKMELTEEKNYSWCACGTSKTQPLCDGSHKILWGTSEKKTGYKWRSLRFKVEKSGSYWMCNCKQTSTPPFCDGTHKQQFVQTAVK